MEILNLYKFVYNKWKSHLVRLQNNDQFETNAVSSLTKLDLNYFTAVWHVTVHRVAVLANLHITPTMQWIPREFRPSIQTTEGTKLIISLFQFDTWTRSNFKFTLKVNPFPNFTFWAVVDVAFNNHCHESQFQSL